MSGLVRTYSAWSRVHSRISRRGVAVVGGAAQVGQAEAGAARELVLGQRLGRRQVEDAGAALPFGPRLDSMAAAPAAGSRATCPRRCRWRSRCAARRGRGRRRRPGASTARIRRAARTPRERGRAATSGQVAVARGARVDDLEVGQAVLAPGTHRPAAPTSVSRSTTCTRVSLSADTDGLPTAPSVSRGSIHTLMCKR